MTRKSLRALWFFFLLLILAACDGHTSVQGYVADESGKPIEGATVVIEDGADKFDDLSDEDGRFDVGLVHAPFTARLTLTVSKEGYKEYKKTFSSNSAPKGNHKVVLEKMRSFQQ